MFEICTSRVYMRVLVVSERTFVARARARVCVCLCVCVCGHLLAMGVLVVDALEAYPAELYYCLIWPASCDKGPSDISQSVDPDQLLYDVGNTYSYTYSNCFHSKKYKCH